MKHTIQLAVLVAAVTLFAGVATARVSGQRSHEHGGGWKKGMVRLSEPAWAGNVRLRQRMYHVRHVIEGERHWLVFKEVALRAGYRGGLMWEGREVARIECRVEPAEKSVRNTRTRVTKIDGMRVIQEIQIAGEHVRHVLPTNLSL